jgi:hypothetical protein
MVCRTGLGCQARERFQQALGAEGGLERFVLAQGLHFETALAEIRGGKKMTHWSWFVFPILEYFVDGRRGGSAQTQLYGLRDVWTCGGTCWLCWTR